MILNRTPKQFCLDICMRFWAGQDQTVAALWVHDTSSAKPREMKKWSTYSGELRTAVAYRKFHGEKIEKIRVRLQSLKLVRLTETALQKAQIVGSRALCRSTHVWHVPIFKRQFQFWISFQGSTQRFRSPMLWTSSLPRRGMLGQGVYNSKWPFGLLCFNYDDNTSRSLK